MEEGLGDENEWLVVHFIESQGAGEDGDGNDEKNSDEKGQKLVEHEANADTPHDIEELLEGERPEDLVLNFYKLGYLVAHLYSITRRKACLPSYSAQKSDRRFQIRVYFVCSLSRRDAHINFFCSRRLRFLEDVIN